MSTCPLIFAKFLLTNVRTNPIGSAITSIIIISLSLFLKVNVSIHISINIDTTTFLFLLWLVVRRNSLFSYISIDEVRKDLQLLGVDLDFIFGLWMPAVDILGFVFPLGQV